MCAYPVNPIAQPSLFVGLGKAGIRCLELVQRRLPSDSMTGAHLIGIRMVDIHRASHADESELGVESLLDLKWDHEQAVRLAAASSGYEWWLNNNGNNNIERLDARMAFHVMKYFYRDSRLQEVLNHAAQTLAVNKDNPLNLYVIASLQEPESAFLGDIVLEIMQQFGSDKVSVRLPCLLVDSDNKDNFGRAAWVSAALREIERFTQKGQLLGGTSKDIYIPDELFSHILLLEDEHCLPALADQLTTLMEKKAATHFSNDFGNLPSPAQFSMTVSRSYSFIVPVQEIRRICAARLLKEELLDAKYFTESKLHVFVSNFLRGIEPSRLEWKFFRILADVLDGKKLNERENLDFSRNSSLTEIFNAGLGEFLNSKFPGTLKDFENFLLALEKDMSQALDECARKGGWFQGMKQHLPQFRSGINDFAREVSRWTKVWNSLKLHVDQRYKQASMELLTLKQESEYGRAILREAEEQTDYTALENGYYSDLKERSEEWQELISNTRKLIIWQWVIPKAQKPYLRCLIDNNVYTDAQSMLPPLWLQANRLTSRLADSESVFEFLGRLSSQEIKTAFDNALPSLQYDPHPALERRFCQYLICASDPMIHDWKLHPGIQHCQINDKKRLTYLGFEYNLPIIGAVFLQNHKTHYISETDAAFVFPHEQYAWQIEQKLKAKNIQGNFPAQLVRLMHNHENFEIAMWCVFWGWVVQKKMSQATHWWLDAGDGFEPIRLDSDNFPALNIENALFNFLIQLPLQDMSGLHPFSKGNFFATMALLREKNMGYQKRSRVKRSEFYDSVRNRIQIWQNSQKPFDQGLALYQTYLLAEDKNRGRK